MDTVRTFGGVLSEKRKAMVAGYEVDVSRIPSRFTLELMRATSGGTNHEELIDIIARICQASNAEVTKDVLLDCLGFDELTELAEYIMAPIVEKAKAKAAKAGEQEAKNP